MSLRDSQHTDEAIPSAGKQRRAVLLTSYQTGATRGRNLGVPGYSYDLVAQLFVPLLARWGEVIPVARHVEALETAARDARQRGLSPIHVSFVACQDMVFTPSTPNVVVPAWEFPDVPTEAFDGNPRNNWVATANRCDLVIVGGEFTVATFQRAGIRTPIHIVPVPTPDEYFQIPRWSAQTTTRIACPAYVFPNPDVPPHALWDAPDVERREDQPTVRPSLKRRLVGRLRHGYRNLMKPLVPPLVHQAMRNHLRPLKNDAWHAYVTGCQRQEVELSGIVFTSIFSPHDGRKNWQDLLSGFLFSLRDCEDATLLVKLITKERRMVEEVLDYYRGMGLLHRCKVIFITDYLSHQQMLDLVRASTYYYTTTRAEGNCLPLMNYLSAGRPGISPCHTAISDYFGDDIGMTLPWHAEPAIWPQDLRARFKTTWARLDWPGLVSRVREGYVLARNDHQGYEAMAARGQQRLHNRASVENVWSQLRAALEHLESHGRPSVSAA